uniref:RAD9-HUS1-RAD1 interacting nuclear orphan 1 n=1 Tax=Acanthochromis polyacanthus TaxID=80966 RepID=A0A3Q1G3D8_9TELE
MPRKVSKSDKPPLLFLERPVCGARLQNAPEVRAALNPREFFTETKALSTPSLNSWVRPEFDSSVAAAPPVKRRRRKCQSATSVLDSCSPLSRKTSVCRYPSLSFHTESRGHQPKTTRTKKATECSSVSNVGNEPQQSCPNKRTASRHSDTPKRQLTSIRKKKDEIFSEGPASHSRCLDQPETPSIQVSERSRLPAGCASTPTSNEFSTADVSSIGPPPDVDTPTVIQGVSSCPSSPSAHLLLAQSCSSPCDGPPDILVADTPERDYGVKVTWRRRKSLMLLLKERGHLSESDASIHS